MDLDVPEAAREEVATTREQIPEENAVLVVHGKIALEAVEDKIIIMLDPFRTGYECKECDGSGVGKACVACDGKGQNRFGTECSTCHGEPNKFVGKDCPVCRGVGASIVVPESVKSLPSSGRVVSAGPLCKTIKVGQRYLFGVHTGYFLPFKGNILLRCMREHEVLCRIYSIDKSVDMGDYFAIPDSSASIPMD